MTLSIKVRGEGGEVTRKRIPLGSPGLRLPLPIIKGYFPRWFNDEVGRIEQALAAGYEFVAPEEAPELGSDIGGGVDKVSRISRVVGLSDTGAEPLRAYLMKLRQEWREEDDGVKQADLDKIDTAIRGGSIGPGDNQRYVKDISYQNR